MAVAIERVEAADGVKLAVGIVDISGADTRISRLGANSKPVILKPNQMDLASILRQLDVSFVEKDFNPLEKIIRIVCNPGESLASLLHAPQTIKATLSRIPLP